MPMADIHSEFEITIFNISTLNGKYNKACTQMMISKFKTKKNAHKN